MKPRSAGLALGALSAHAGPTPFPADFRSSAAIYATPGAMHAAFAQFLAIGQKDEALLEEAPAVRIAAVQDFLAPQ